MNKSINGLLLYLHGYSFYAQRVMMALYEKKLSYEPFPVDILSGENYQPWFLDINPKGEVPVLKDGVKIIPDSSRIIDYLEDNFSSGDTPRLIPTGQGNELKVKVEYFRELIDKIPANTVTIGCCFHSDYISNPRLPFIAPVRALMKAGDGKNAEKLREVAAKYPQYAEVLLAKAVRAEENHLIASDDDKFAKLMNQVNDTLEEVEKQLSNVSANDWLISEMFTVADVYLSVLLERLSQVGLEERLWAGVESPVKPNIHRYYQRVKLRPSMVHIIPTTYFHIKTLIGTKVLAIASGVTILAILGGAFYWWRKSSTN